MLHLSIGATRRRAATVVGLLLAAAVLLGAEPAGAVVLPPALDLGSAASFAVLAGGGVTDTGPSTIAGDVGTHPVAAIPDLLDSEATGAVHRADGKANEAQRDLSAALATTGHLPVSGTVSLRKDVSVAPGVHLVSAGSPGLGGDVTLDGRGLAGAIWIFVVPQDLVTAPGSAIRLLNGAQACNVFWLVGGSASLGSASGFAGTIAAETSVTVGRRVTIAGRLLARSGAVALAGDAITVPTCSRTTDAASRVAATVSPAQPVLPAQASSSKGTAAPGRGTLPPYLPMLMVGLLVASALLGEPRRQRHRRSERYRW